MYSKIIIIKMLFWVLKKIMKFEKEMGTTESSNFQKTTT